MMRSTAEDTADDEGKGEGKIDEIMPLPPHDRDSSGEQMNGWPSSIHDQI